MFQSGSEEETVDRERNCQEFQERHSSSFAEKLESFVEDLVAHQYDEEYRKNDIAVREDMYIDEIESENGIESENEQKN